MSTSPPRPKWILFILIMAAIAIPPVLTHFNLLCFKLYELQMKVRVLERKCQAPIDDIRKDIPKENLENFLDSDSRHGEQRRGHHYRNDQSQHKNFKSQGQVDECYWVRNSLVRFFTGQASRGIYGMYCIPCVLAVAILLKLLCGFSAGKATRPPERWKKRNYSNVSLNPWLTMIILCSGHLTDAKTLPPPCVWKVRLNQSISLITQRDVAGADHDIGVSFVSASDASKVKVLCRFYKNGTQISNYSDIECLPNGVRIAKARGEWAGKYLMSIISDDPLQEDHFLTVDAEELTTTLELTTVSSVINTTVIGRADKTNEVLTVVVPIVVIIAFAISVTLFVVYRRYYKTREKSKSQSQDDPPEKKTMLEAKNNAEQADSNEQC